MTNAELIQKIRAEIERLMDEYKPIVGGVDETTGAHIVLAKLLSFLDTLQEEPDKDLEDAAKEYCKTIFHKPFSENPQEEHIVYEPDKYDGFIAGAQWKEKQMLKQAMEGYVNYYEDSGGILMAEAQVGCPYHNGDKVRIIVLPMED